MHTFKPTYTSQVPREARQVLGITEVEATQQECTKGPAWDTQPPASGFSSARSCKPKPKAFNSIKTNRKTT